MSGQEVSEELRELRKENELLRERLEGIEAREEKAQKARKRLMKGGFRVLVPLLDRQKVVRNFGKLAETVSAYSGPPSGWPTRDEVLAATRDFMESVVRFLIRQRLFLMLFALIGTAIPAIQIWLVFQQNQIIENQNKFQQVQVFDIVSRSMTQGDRNARVMTGALLANAELPFLRNVITEAFSASSQAVYRREGLEASARRAKDTAFRGNLIRAAVRAAEKQLELDKTHDELFREMRPIYVHILRDSQFRLAEVIRTGRGETSLSGEILEDVDRYIAQVGDLLKMYGRVARSADEEELYLKDIRGLLSRMSRVKSVGDSTFAGTYRIVMQDFLFELADKTTLTSGPFELKEREPDAVLQAGIQRLKNAYGGKALNWNELLSQVRQ